MLNVEKAKHLAKQKGIKIGHLCAELGKKHTYLNDIARGDVKNVPEEHIRKIAGILGTTYEYLTDQEEAAVPQLVPWQSDLPSTADIARRAARSLKFSEMYEKIAQKETAEADLQELERFMEYLVNRK